MNSQEDCPFLSRVIFRSVQPTDIPRCYSIESASYPPDEAASKSNLQYRQHHAASYFRCAFLIDEPPPPEEAEEGRGMKGMSVTGCIIGYICSTRCQKFTEKSMKEHDPNGKYLAIHSVAVHEKYRKRGVGSAMLKDYWEAMERLNTGILQGGKKKGATMEKIVLMAKKQMLAFYVRNGFSVTRLSDIVHGQDEWFELERKFSIQTGRKCYLVDAFVDPGAKEGRSGNPAGVILLDGPPGLGVNDDEKKQKMRFAASCESLDEIIKIDEDDKQDTIPAQCQEWMSAVAKELNQSETAFVWPIENVMVQNFEFQHVTSTMTALKPVSSSPCPSTYAIRYYTRTGVEVDLCGHATLASASVLLDSNVGKQHRKNSITFYAKRDVLCAKLKVCCPPDTRSRIAMDFPWKNVSPLESGSGRDVVLDMISRAFFGAHAAAANSVVNPVDTSVGAKFRQFFNPKDPDLFHHITLIGTTDGKEDLFVELTEEGFDLLRGIDVDHSALCSWSGYSRGVIICCPCETTSSDTPDFRSRFFGPKVGINEDAVTGSAHCSLGPYFGNKLNKTVVVGQQESQRGGLVECTLKAEERRVEIVGTAVKTMSGIMAIDL